MNSEPITNAERYPTLTAHGQRMLEFLREHPHAPIYRNTSGNRLTPEDVEQVRAFERQVLTEPVGWSPGTLPEWLNDFVTRCLAEIPFYRRYGAPPRRFEDLPTVSRADLSLDIASFVPDHAPIERLINFRTSGTTGHPLLLASHPVVAANYLAFHKRALRRVGIELRYGRGQVGVVLAGFQRHCFTYVSVTPTMDESGLAKINLHPNDWRHSDDRAKYLDALAPEVYTGDPLAFAELITLPLQTRPCAMLSTSMTLLPALQQKLTEHFGCPVLDIYSMNEAGPIAVADASLGGHVLLQHCLYVEILDQDGNAVPTGTTGEITLSGGFNFCLPLLRYRTGDYAALKFGETEPVLVGLTGRPPIRFRGQNGEWLNNIEITHALQRFAIPQFTLRQRSDNSLCLRMAGTGIAPESVRKVMVELFGPGSPLEIETGVVFDHKTVQYTSELSLAQS